ncbi:MAG: hypothetical protein ABSB73_07615 [Solirubrobacteraceae bacterium]
MRVADQFLFGYDDGHRLLTGSRELAPATAVSLLAATDAAMADGAAPLVTGLALAESSEYAFCVTWSATESPRPGAVWAHALIVAQADLDDPHALEVLIGLPRRPHTGGIYLGDYRAALPLDGVTPAAPRYLPAGALDLELLERLALAAYDPGADTIVTHDEISDAAKALIALWRAQWPSLRTAFSFRTRHVVRQGAGGFDLTVTRKVRGQAADGAPATATAPRPWLAGVVEDAAATGTQPTPLRDFLWTFGPLEPRDPRRVAALATLWRAIVARDAAGARAQLEREWPAPQSGAELKAVLFAPENDDWWALSEPAR